MFLSPPRLGKIVDHLSTLTERVAVDPTNAVGVIVNATIALDWGKRFRVWNVLLLAVRQIKHLASSRSSWNVLPLYDPDCHTVRTNCRTCNSPRLHGNAWCRSFRRGDSFGCTSLHPINVEEEVADVEGEHPAATTVGQIIEANAHLAAHFARNVIVANHADCPPIGMKQPLLPKHVAHRSSFYFAMSPKRQNRMESPVQWLMLIP